jgi:gliding motility-associated-like protein
MKYWTILVFCLIGYSQIFAVHILGTDVTYRNVSCDADGFVIEISFTIYRDVYQGGNIDFTSLPNDIEVAIYQRDLTTGDFILDDPRRNVFRVDVGALRKEPVALLGNDCFDKSLEDIFRTDKFVYVRQRIALDYIDSEYRISTQRCCRSSAIVSIENPASTGFLSEVIITPEAQRACNSSPVFDLDPEIVICNGFPQVILSGATDPDGDVLEYSFTTPQVAGGSLGDASNPCPATDTAELCKFECDGTTPDAEFCLPNLFGEVEYVPGFNADNPILADVPFVIDRNTGVISGTAAGVGTYIVGVKVEEFRNGQKIGEIIRDFNVSVANCNQEAVIGPPNQRANLQNFIDQCGSGVGPAIARIAEEYDPCGASVVELENYSSASPDDITFRWTVYDETGTTEIARNEVDWDPSFTLPVASYIVRYTVFPDLLCEASCEMVLDVTPPIETNFSLDIDNDLVCGSRPINIDLPLQDPNATYAWDFGDGTTSDDYDPGPIVYANAGNYEVGLTVTRGTCTPSFSSSPFDFVPLPTDVTVFPDRFLICGDQQVNFEHVTLTDPSTFSYTWDFGDGETSDQFQASHEYQSEGIYEVSLEIATTGCSTSTTFPWELEVLPSPKASFEPSIDAVKNPSQSVGFMNTSTGASGFEWDFGDNSPVSFEENPTYQYRTVGEYEVILSAFSPVNDCVDTASVILPVTAAGRPIFPNAFRPLTGRNSEFKPVSIFDNFESYELRIFDRYGQIVFETLDFTQGWNGRKNNSGSMMPRDVYTYQYSYEVIDGDQRVVDGDVGTVLLMN